MIADIGLLSLPIVTAWFFAPQLANAFDIKHHISILVTTALVLVFILSGARNVFAIPKGVIGGSLLAWILAVTISAICAGNSYLSARMLLEVFVFLLLAIALFNLRDIGAAQRKLEMGIVVAGLGVAIFALKQYFLPDVLDPGFSALGKLKIYSTLGNSNLAALIILASLPLAAYRSLRDSISSRAVYAAFTLLLFGGLLATQARHALIAIAAMVVVGLLWMGSRETRRAVFVCVFVAAGIGITVLSSIDLPPSVIHSIKGRGFIWLTSLQMLREHPFVGVGLGHFGLNHMAYQSELFASGKFDSFFDNASVISEGHNDFLNWGAMTGILGLFAFMGLCAGAVWKGWHSPNLKKHAPHLYLALVGYIVAMFFVAVTSYTVPSLFFWLLLGMVLARSDLARIEWLPHAWVRHSFAIVLAALLVVDGHLAWREVKGGLLEADGDKLMEEHDLWLAEKRYQQALLWNPHNSELQKKHSTTLFLSGDLHHALAELEIAKGYSGDLGIYLLEGELLTRIGDLDHAVAVYRQITASFPNLVGPHFILGQVYLLQGKRGDAVVEFHKVLDIRPSPFNLNMTVEKVELQKRIIGDYLSETATNPTPPVKLPDVSEDPD